MVRRFFVLLGCLLVLLPAFEGCGINEEGGLSPDAGGAGGQDGGGGVGGGQCFPGDKVCPDPNDPKELLCLKADDPKYGCSGSTACAPCALPHASAKCTSGACAIDTCDTGWDDCNNSPTDGCETDLNGDKNHCGNCAKDCVAEQGPGWICNGGTCEVNECCPTGAASCQSLRDCDGNKANGCEVDVANDATNCKTCGNACALANAAAGCSQEVCVVTGCNGGWANCDTNDANGCEININQGDKGNCGACKKACNETNAGATCQGGNCVLACFPNFGNCDNNPDNGCEVNTNTSTAHCGGCGKGCNPAHVTAAACNAGVCEYAACQPGWSDCDGNKANGCEINILQNVNHCGGCGQKCTPPSGGTVLCSNGSCAQACGAGLTNCGGVCVNTGTDTSNCGSCGNACSPPANSTATCSPAPVGCGFTCNSGWAKCGTLQCWQVATDEAHCCTGAGCNTSCANCPGPTSGTGSPLCNSGACTVTCSSPTTLRCGTACYNPTNDKQHCGNCTTVCTNPANGTNNCVTGACTITCNTNFHKCGSLCKADDDPTACGTGCVACPGPTAGTGAAVCTAGTGTCSITCSGSTPDLCGTACVDKQKDNANCGTCGTVCQSGKNCSNGNCVGSPTDGGTD